MNDKPKELEEHSAQIFELGCMERPVYLKEDVDAVIAGLKQKLQDQCISCPVKMQEDDMVAEKDNEIRRLKRALWLARAERAVAEQTVDEWSRYKEKHPFGSWRADPFEYWVQEWIYVEKICRKNAKEYR